MFQFIVIGPGPGHPAIESDIGIISWLIKSFNNKKMIIMLYLYWGFVLDFKVYVMNLVMMYQITKVKHGQVYDIYPVSKSELFPDDESPFGSVRYHSLYVENTNDEIILGLLL